MRIRKNKRNENKSRIFIKTQTALVKLRTEQIKLGALAASLKAKADKLRREEEYRLDKTRNTIEDLKNECFLHEIKNLQNQLSLALEQLEKAKQNNR